MITIKKVNPSKESSRFDKTLSVMSLGVLLGCLVILARAFQLQILEHEYWKARYQAQIYTDRQINITRKPITDCNGKLLAYSVEEYSLYANPKQVTMDETQLLRLSKILGLNKSEIEKRLRKSGKFILVSRFISDHQANEILQLNLKGLYLLRETKRFYPNRWLAGQVLGFVGFEGAGLEGVEKEYDQFLNTPSTKSRFVRDGIVRKIWLGDILPSLLSEEEYLTLTIDSFIQYVTEKALFEVVKKYQAESAQAIVMDVRNFHILAMANYPFFDPNLYKSSYSHVWKNRALSDIFEPGSTFKAILAAALLEEKAVKPTDKVFCENGSFKVPGHVIKDVHPHGLIDFTQVIQFSSNIGAAKLALNLGAKKYGSYIERFGFGKPTGLDLPGEAAGILRPSDKWRPLDLATAAFGQGIGVTTVQLATAFAVIANGGYIGQPKITVKDKLTNTQDKTLNGVFRRILKAETSEQLKRILEKVTQEGGTGVAAQVPGYRVGGKTGTAQKIDPSTGKYSQKEYASIFVGFAPLMDTHIVIAIIVHNPKGATYGGVVAGPAFKEIASRVLPHLGVKPSENPYIKSALNAQPETAYRDETKSLPRKE